MSSSGKSVIYIFNRRDGVSSGQESSRDLGTISSAPCIVNVHGRGLVAMLGSSLPSYNNVQGVGGAAAEL